MSKSSKSAADAAESAPEKISAHAQELMGEVDDLAESLGETVHDLQEMVDEQVSERPYTSLAAAAALGFVLGGGLTVRVGRLLMGYGGRTAAKMLYKRLTKAI